MRRRGHFTRDQEAILMRAIAEAEDGNRGEVRVHVEPTCPGDDPLGRAAELFEDFGMEETSADTGVLLYVAIESKACAVYAGEGIHGAGEEDFWQDVSDAIANGYRRNDPIAGFEMALLRLGALLREHVPGEDVAGDELPNLVTTS